MVAGRAVQAVLGTATFLAEQAVQAVTLEMAVMAEQLLVTV
jgi:hypothetical protein